MKLIRNLALLAGLILTGVAFADTELLGRADVQRYIDEQVNSGRFNRPELEAVFANIQSKPNIIKILDRPSTSQPWYRFRVNHVSESLITRGTRFWADNAADLARAEQVYGVPASMIVAIIGIETNYGSNTGSFRVVDALTTIGFDYPRRAEFFRNELTEFLLLAKEERSNPLTFKGSYAGAMGMPQFMPSSFRKWAVDFDGDGHRDIWGSRSDAIGSVANYFKQHGWQRGGALVVPAQVQPGPKIEQLVGDKFNLHYTVRELKRMGITPMGNVADSELAVLVPLETSAGTTEYWLGLNNYYVITRYNKSTLYAKAAQELSEAIQARYQRY